MSSSTRSSGLRSLIKQCNSKYVVIIIIPIIIICCCCSAAADGGDDNDEDDDDGDDDKDRAIHLPARHLLHMPLGNKFLKLWNLESEKICQTLLGFDDIENKCSVSFILTRMST